MRHRLTVSRQGREPQSLACQLQILRASRRRERSGLVHSRLRDRNDLRAVDQTVAVVSKDRELRHCRLEAGRHELLFVHEALPEARRALVTSECEVGLQTHLAGVAAAGEGERGGDFTSVVVRAGEAFALEQDFEEDLGVEGERGLKK